MLPDYLEKIQNVLHQNTLKFFSWNMQEKLCDKV